MRSYLLLIFWFYCLFLDSRKRARNFIHSRKVFQKVQKAKVLAQKMLGYSSLVGCILHTHGKCAIRAFNRYPLLNISNDDTLHL